MCFRVRQQCFLQFSPFCYRKSKMEKELSFATAFLMSRVQQIILKAIIPS